MANTVSTSGSCRRQLYSTDYNGYLRLGPRGLPVPGRDRAGQFTASSGAVPADAGIEAVKIPPRSARECLCRRFALTARTQVTDRMLINPRSAPVGKAEIMERWIGSCRRDLLDRTLIWNQRHMMTVLREYEDFCNTHRPHRTLNQAAPLRPLPDSVTSLDHFRVWRRDRAGGVIHKYRLVA